MWSIPGISWKSAFSLGAKDLDCGTAMVGQSLRIVMVLRHMQCKNLPLLAPLPPPSRPHPCPSPVALVCNNTSHALWVHMCAHRHMGTGTGRLKDCTAAVFRVLLFGGAGRRRLVFGHARHFPRVHIAVVTHLALLRPPLAPLQQLLLIPAPTVTQLLSLVLISVKVLKSNVLKTKLFVYTRVVTWPVWILSGQHLALFAGPCDYVYNCITPISYLVTT